MREDERNFMQMNQGYLKRWGAAGRLCWAACLLAAAWLTGGCGGGKATNSGSFADPPAASQYNNYAGTQTYELLPDGFEETGGVWDITLDDTNKFFTYTDISIPPYNVGGNTPPYPIEGGTNTAGGYLKLTLNGKSSGSGGYALEIPGRAAIVRPADTSSLVVISAAASTSGCQGLAQQTTFEFMTLWPPYNTMVPAYAAYGSIQASSSGTAWSFANLQMFTQDGTAINPPMPSSGLCTYTQEGYVTYIAPEKATQNLPWTVVVGPSGYLVIDQGQGNGPVGDGPEAGNWAIGPFGLVGFPQPAGQIDTNALVSGSYLGFTYNSYAASAQHPVTQPIAFTGGSGTLATGGLFPKDDPTQTPPANIAMDLGQQDSSTNGLYKSVTVTIPDTYNGCAGQSYGGTDANGNPTCILHGIAIAGQVEGKYVLYVSLADRSLETLNLPGAALEYFLYQH
jgi:hypothetical protein